MVMKHRGKRDVEQWVLTLYSLVRLQRPLPPASQSPLPGR